MAFTSVGLPNEGKTARFWVSYDETLSKAKGLDLALDLLNHCESDMDLMPSWFPGVLAEFLYAFPIRLQITGEIGGAEWVGIPLSGPAFVTLKPGSTPTTPLLRYLVVSEVTEMFMRSQGKSWHALFDEGSIGEALSRFLASHFLATTNLSKNVFSGFQVAYVWLNDSTRPNFVDTAPDDTPPDNVTGCGTCFLFFLKDQVGRSVQEIIAASAPTLAGVYANLTGETDGWRSFKGLVDLHYPSSKSYFPPLDNIFPVSELHTLSASSVLSWVVNATPNTLWISLADHIPVAVDVMLASDDPATISVPEKVSLNSSATVVLTVPAQHPGFTVSSVTLTASYAGKQLSALVKVVRPENLPVAPLQIVSGTEDDPCAQHLVEGTAEQFAVRNPNVILDHTGLAYKWSVVGTTAPVTDQTTLNIPSLPPAGTKVTVQVQLTNAAGIRACRSSKRRARRNP